MCPTQEGEPCPKCKAPLIVRRSTFRTIAGDVLYCARCCSSFEYRQPAADRKAVRRASAPAPA